MALNVKYNKYGKEHDYDLFVEDLRNVLKKDTEHSIPFDNVLFFKSRRYDCILSAADVRLDSKSGELVMVGAFRSGNPIIDMSKGFPEFKVDVEIPLREVYDDLRISSGQEDRLINKAKKAVLDKYVMGFVNDFEKRGLLEDGRLSFDKFGFEEADTDNIAELRFYNGKVMVLSGDSVNERRSTRVSRYRLSEIQSLGKYLKQIDQKYNAALEVFHARKKELEPFSMTRTERDVYENNKEALMAMYDGNFPMSICNSIASNLAGSDIFDLSKHSLGEITTMVEDFRASRRSRKHYSLL